jgi:hypothetical protein
MTIADIDRVFGRCRLRMVTGDHVEVFREASQPGERRRYTKRFLATESGDFRQWTEREWRILARLVGHGIAPVPDVVQYDRGADGRPALVQTYDAGITVDHWGTLLPVQRDGIVLRHVFEDCAHWWALARHCLMALDAIHEIQLVHLDLKADNVCIPASPADFDPHALAAQLSPRFDQIALIDFAFSLVSGENLVSALPIARQTDYEYQSPRLLEALDAGRRGNLLPTRHLDWRCDIYSLAAMLRRYLPNPEGPHVAGWSAALHGQARALVRRLLEVHDTERPARRPHGELIALATQPLDDANLAESLEYGWELALSLGAAHQPAPTPVTRIAMPIAPIVFVPAARNAPLQMQPEPMAAAVAAEPGSSDLETSSASVAPQPGPTPARPPAWLSVGVSVVALGLPLLGDNGLAHRTAPPAPGAAPERIAAAAADTTPTPVMRAAPAARAIESAASASTTAVATAGSTESAGAEAPASQAPDVPTAATATPAAASVAAATSSTRPPAGAAVRAAPTPTSRSTPTAAAPAQRTRVISKPAATASAETRVRVAPPLAVTARPRAKALPLAHGFDPKRRLAELRAAAPAPAPASAPASTLPQAATIDPVAVAVRPTASAPARAGAEPAAPDPTVDRRALPTPPDTSAEARPSASQPNFAIRAEEVLAIHLPRIAARAERLVMRVLQLAADDEEGTLVDEIRDAAIAIRLAPGDPALEPDISSIDAGRLNAAAKAAFRDGGRLDEALDLQKRAFGANPLNAEVAGYLAFLRLRQRPAQVESARQLALHALTTYDARYPQGRIEDWTTLAVASALAGRDSDARNAWFVTLALVSDPQRQCRAAVNAYAMYGERLRHPVEAMLQRVHATGRSEASPLCEWPPHRDASRRMR